MKRLLLIITILIYSLYSQAQGLAETAKQYFQDENYEVALDMYKQLNKQFPSSNTYNFRYAVCLLKTNTDIDESIKRLSTTAKKGVLDSYLYLGECYAKQYLFQKALDNFNLFVKKKRPKGEELEDVNKQITLAQTGVDWLKKVLKIQVYDTLTVDLAEFYKQYQLSPEVGTLSYQIPLELGKSSGTSFTNQKNNRIVYTTLNGTQQDLSQACKFVDQWEDENRIDSTINSGQDEAYPFLLADGQTLYFCSKGHHSIGGYDIFTTRYNPQTGKYYPPVNLGFPFNSPDDDLLMVIDEFQNVAQFSSTRNCEKGKIRIYSFIPTKINEYLNTSDPKKLVQAAQLKLDSSNWVKAPKSVQEGKQFIPDFRFEVKDKLVYHYESDFKNPLALMKYRKYQEEEKHLQWVIKELERKRSLVHQRKPYDKEEIKRMEMQIPQMTQLLSQLLQEARQAELSKL